MQIEKHLRIQTKHNTLEHKTRFYCSFLLSPCYNDDLVVETR